ncbi:MAG: hypothetical protein Q8Q23_05205 [bacterium]|nr:hypothetical protein [bacterium]
MPNIDNLEGKTILSYPERPFHQILMDILTNCESEGYKIESLKLVSNLCSIIAAGCYIPITLQPQVTEKLLNLLLTNDDYDYEVFCFIILALVRLNGLKTFKTTAIEKYKMVNIVKQDKNFLAMLLNDWQTFLSVK